MYVANCTMQIQDFIYRLPENLKARQQRIEIGQQIQISGDLSTQDIEAIIQQHSPYGLIAADEVDRSRGAFIGLCYSLDKPVNMARVQSALDNNSLVLTERGHMIRQEAGLATHKVISDGNPGVLQSMDFEVVEQPSKDGRDIQVNEKIKIDPKASPPSGNPKRAAGGGRRR